MNLKVLSLLCEDREKQDADLPKLLNISSCGLHIVHGDFVQDARLQSGKYNRFSEHYGICSMIHLQEEMTSKKLLGQQSFLSNSVQPG